MSAKERWDCCTEQPAVQHSAADDFLCPICLEVVSQATWLVAGNNAPQLYDRSCLIHWFEHGVLPRRVNVACSALFDKQGHKVKLTMSLTRFALREENVA